MRTRSFRVRIALLSVLCSSLVLLGSALYTGTNLWKTELTRVDAFIASFVRQELNRMPRPPKLHGPGGPAGFGHDFPRPEPPPDEFPPGPGPGGHGPDRGPWNEPPWRRGPGVRDDVLTAPATVYVFKDLQMGFVRRSGNWPKTLNENDLIKTTDSTIAYTTLSAGGRLWRIAAGANAQHVGVFGVDLEPSVAAVKQLASAFLLSIPVALALIAFGAIFMANRALRPVDDLARLVERITASGLSERIQSPVRDAEFEKLILVFNQMLDRLERSFTQANRFSADAAHELRTPLTILQGYVERMLHEAEPGSRMQQQLGEMVDEIHRIKSILEKLLLLARMDAGQVRLNMSPLDLSTTVRGIAEDIQALSPKIVVETEIEPGIRVNADAALLETAIQNLAGNAAKYNREHDGRILIQLSNGHGEAVLTIANTGPKIQAGDGEKIFERFYRADKSRSRDVDGLGLGLSLAREIVEAHHGRLELADGGDDMNRFVMRLPLNENACR
ncbi:HAMP domain-containing protein [bacterium]|nr:HAMP domain-containing protein [bacterium]